MDDTAVSPLLMHIPMIMMTSSNGNIFRVTGPLCGEFTSPGDFPTQRPVTRSFDVSFDLRPNKRSSNQWWGWWFDTQSRSLWRHHNDPSSISTTDAQHSSISITDVQHSSISITDAQHSSISITDAQHSSISITDTHPSSISITMHNTAVSPLLVHLEYCCITR